MTNGEMRDSTVRALIGIKAMDVFNESSPGLNVKGFGMTSESVGNCCIRLEPVPGRFNLGRR